MRTILLVGMFISTVLNSLSQFGVEWAHGMGSSGQDRSKHISIDENGYLFATGTFSGTIDIDPGPSTQNLESHGGLDIFVSKSDENGNLIWAYAIGSSQADFGRCVEPDENGDIYVTGYFSGNCDFDPGNEVFTLGTSGGLDIFILKLTNDGAFIWAEKFGAGGTDVGYYVKPDMAGNIFITGTFSNSVDFDPSNAVNTLTSEGDRDAYVGKYDYNGELLWVHSYGSADWDNGYEVGIDSVGNSYFSGFFHGSPDFNGDNPGGVMTSFGGTDGFITKYNPDGELIYHKQIGGSGDDYVFIFYSDLGYVYAGGHYQNDIDIDPGPDTSMYYADGIDMYYAKYDGDMNLIWGRGFGGEGDDKVQMVRVDNDGSYVITGEFEESVDFNPGPADFTLTSQGGIDYYVLIVDSDGLFAWAGGYGSVNDDWVYAHALNNDDIYLTGFNTGDITYPTIDGPVSYDNSGIEDLYTLKIQTPQCPVNITKQYIELCFGDEAIVGNNVYIQEGIYTDTLSGINGCDSIIFSKIDINEPIVNSIGITPETLYAQAQEGATYQWIDCNNGNEIIPDQNTTEFTPSASGSFAAIITIDGCSDTTVCQTITSIEPTQDFSSISIFPNPTQLSWRIVSNAGFIMTLYDSGGKLVSERRISPGTTTLDASTYARGSYLLVFKNEQEQITKKLLVE